MKVLYELCEMLEDTAKDLVADLRKKSGRMTSSDLDAIDKVTHAIKSVKTTLAMVESEGQYNRGGMYQAGYQNGGYGDGGYQRRSRDSQGRYMANNDLYSQVKHAMENESDPRKAEEYGQILERLSRM